MANTLKELMKDSDLFPQYKDSLQTSKGILEYECVSILNATEMNQLYQRIISSLYDEDEEYMPQFFEYIFRNCVIDAYTNIKLPDDTDEAYLWCYSTLWNKIEIVINESQLRHIREAVESYVLQRKHEKASKAHITSVMNDLNTITQAVLNMGNLPEWFAANLENEDIKSPLLKK